MKQVLPCLLGCSLLGLASPAFAQSDLTSIVSEVHLGVLAHDIGVLGQQKEHGVDINGEIDFVSPVPDRLIAGIDPRIRWLLDPRPNIGIDANIDGYTSQIYFGLLWTADLFDAVLLPDDHIFFSVGFGPSFNNGYHSSPNSNHKSLGANVLFHPSLEIGYAFTRRYNVSLYYDHSSNGGLDAHNDGLNNLGIRFGIHF
jgi:lipid A 3-O-deacylase